MTRPTSADVPTRSDRRRERTRRSLLDAGRSLITSKGVAGLRIGEITEGADVALGSFYNHFGSKDELVDAVVADSLTALAAAVVGAASPEEDAARVVAEAIRRVVRLAYDDPAFARLVVELTHSERLLVTAVEPHARLALQRGVDAGRFDVEDIGTTLIAVAGGALALIDAILAGEAPAAADEVFAGWVLRALGIRKGEARRIARTPLEDDAT